MAFLDALVAGDLAPEAQRVEMTAAAPTPCEGHSWGLGVTAQDTACGRLYGHDSDGPGESAELWRCDSLGATVVAYASSQTESSAVQLVDVALEVVARPVSP